MCVTPEIKIVFTPAQKAERITKSRRFIADLTERLMICSEDQVNATSSCTAINRATREYLKELSRKEKRDAGKLIEVRCTMVATTNHD